MQTQLIMVEGVPFTGKSTLSEFAALQLGLSGLPAQWVPEGVMLHRYFPHVLAVLENHQSISEALLWADWSTFAQAVKTTSTRFVVDAALSFAAIFPLLAADRPPEAIRAELKRIAEVCAPLHPRVIHLTGDVDRLARTSIDERGAGWQEHMVRQSDTAPYQQARERSGVAGATAFLEDTQAFTRMVLQEDGWQTLTLDVTATDWETNRRALLRFLEIVEVPIEHPTLTRSDLESYTGTYATDDPTASNDALSVQLEQETLALHSSRMRFGTLVPVSATRFHVIATEFDTEFVVEEGVALRLVVFTPDGKARVYHRT